MPRAVFNGNAHITNRNLAYARFDWIKAPSILDRLLQPPQSFVVCRLTNTLLRIEISNINICLGTSWNRTHNSYVEFLPLTWSLFMLDLGWISKNSLQLRQMRRRFQCNQRYRDTMKHDVAILGIAVVIMARHTVAEILFLFDVLFFIELSKYPNGFNLKQESVYV